MARSHSISLKKTPRLLRFFPDSWQDFIRTRIDEATALITCLGGAFILLSLISYESSDPSLNTASNTADLHNWMGRYGAVSSDILLQTFGIGAFVFGFGFVIWGWRIWKQDNFRPVAARLLCLIASALLLGIAGGVLPSGGLLGHATLGGAGGILLLNLLTGWIDGLIPVLPHVVVAFFSGILGFFLFSLGIALRSTERRAVIEGVLNGSAATLDGAYGLWDRMKSWRQGGQQNEYEPDDEEEDAENESYDEDDEEGEDDSGRDTTGNIKVVRPEKGKDSAAKTKKKKSEQPRLDLKQPSEWEIPSLELLQQPPPAVEEHLDETALRRNAELLQNVLSDYNVRGDIVSIHPGPVVTLYELEPAPGTKTSRVVGLSDDIARSMSAVSVRVAVVPGRNVIGIELPNKRRQTVYLRDLLEGRDFEKTTAALPLVLGKDIGGKPIIADLARMPHLLVAGTTGSGKSVAVNTMILSLLYRLPPEKCRFIMIDPKMLELSIYDDIPHLLTSVVTEPGRAVVALKWTVQEMENRYRNMSKLGVRNIEGYNIRLAEARKKGEVLMRKMQTGFDPETGKPVFEEQPLDLTELPYIVVVVDEFADLMLVAGKDVENAIQRLAQMARAAGIHLIMATQRPSVDVITGVIKANFPTRISFQVTSKIDSRTILGEGGAETLLGMGDMLYMAAGGRLTRVHGPFVSDREVEDVVGFLKAQGSPSYLDEITDGDLFGESGEGGEEGGGSGDELYDEAVALVAREGKASTSFIQRHLQIGYNRAARIIEQMEKEGVVTPANRVGKREVLVGHHGH
jgi:S-DNA-T family DNA segregation ATPase FtsK/SpoIIIE